MPRYQEPGVYPIKVQYEEVDSAGVVHHPNYLRYCERARLAYVREAGYSYSTMLQEGVGIVVAEIHQKYLKPLFYDVEAVVVTRVAGTSRSSLRLFQHIFPKSTPDEIYHQPLAAFARSPERIFAAQLRLVCVDWKTGTPIPYPDRWRAAFEFPSEGSDPIASKTAVQLNYEMI